MTHRIPRRRFLCLGGLALVGAYTTGGIAQAASEGAAERKALAFVRRYSGKLVVKDRRAEVTRLMVEVTSVNRLGSVFQNAPRHGITHLHVAGPLATFRIGGHTFEIENLLPRDFAAAEGAV